MERKSDLTSSVAQRFAAQQPPQWLRGAVASGELVPESLDAWASVASDLGRHFNMAAAVAYWENEMRVRRLPLPTKLIPPLESDVDTGELTQDWKGQFLASTFMRNGLIFEKAKPLGYEYLDSTLRRHLGHHNPTVDFEKQFQFYLILLRKHLARKTEDPSWGDRLEALMRKVDKLLSGAGA